MPRSKSKQAEAKAEREAKREATKAIGEACGERIAKEKEDAQLEARALAKEKEGAQQAARAAKHQEKVAAEEGVLHKIAENKAKRADERVIESAANKVLHPTSREIKVADPEAALTLAAAAAAAL